MPCATHPSNQTCSLRRSNSHLHSPQPLNLLLSLLHQINLVDKGSIRTWIIVKTERRMTSQQRLCRSAMAANTVHAQCERNLTEAVRCFQIAASGMCILDLLYSVVLSTSYVRRLGLLEFEPRCGCGGRRATYSSV